LFSKMRHLQFLYLEKNSFTGELDDTLIENWPKLMEIDVSGNMIGHSHFPISLLKHKTLIVADVSSNFFSGSFPDDIFENTQLQFLAIHNNNIAGTIPDRIGFLKHLSHFDASFNQITGTLPDTIGMMTNLKLLATTGNKFDEQPLVDLSRLSNLVDLSMKGNNMVGTIGDWIGNLNKLEMLDLDANHLVGSIPSWIGMLSSLNHLLLNRNQLTGTLPTEMARLHYLDVLLLDGNSITGDAQAICLNEKINTSYFTADCYPRQNGVPAEIECRCCSTCCMDEDTTCNNKAWTNSYDPIWEYGYVRPAYRFSLENAPVEFAKDEAQLLYTGENEIVDAVP
jgi:Leucine-rich repeat (LRR) protein